MESEIVAPSTTKAGAALLAMNEIVVIFLDQRLCGYTFQAVFQGGDKAKIFDDVLFKNGAQRHDFVIRYACKSRAENLFNKEDTPGVVQEETMPTISQMAFSMIH